jgi:hypothetical protein
MQLSIRKVVEPALALAAAVLLALLVVPWEEPQLPSAAASRQSAKPKAQAELQAARYVASTDAVVTLFVGKQAPKAAAASATPTQPVAKPVSAAPWLRYMGRSSAADGKSYVYVKDTKSGKVIRAAQAEAVNGWTLVSEDDEGLVLKSGEDLYAVSKR